MCLGLLDSGPNFEFAREVPVPRTREWSKFVFDFDGDEHFATYTPAEDKPWEDRLRTQKWEFQRGALTKWLMILRRELDAPDLWGELARERERVSATTTDAENTPFSSEEQAEIAAQMHEITAYVRDTYQLTAEKSAAIELRLDYLTEAASRMGRNDWRHTLVGVLLGAIVQAVLPREPIQEVLNLTLRGLAHLFGVDIPELPGGWRAKHVCVAVPSRPGAVANALIDDSFVYIPSGSAP